MRRRAAALGSLVLVAGAVAGGAYLALGLFRVRAFARRSRPRPRRTPPMTILKPLRGLEPALEENLASFFEQAYPDFQIVFSAVDPQDPAIAVARTVVARFPDVDAEVVVADAIAGVRNPKIANALNAYPLAKHPVIVMADADMRVGPTYLQSIAAAFEEENVGAVTCIYAGVAEGGIVSELAAMFINDHFAPSVLVAGALEPLRYTFGSTMAVKRDVLERIGGFSALGATVADDHRLGALVAGAGARVVLASCVVENVQERGSLWALLQRELRWARTIRSVRPAGSTFAVVTYALPLALLAWLLEPRSATRAAILGTVWLLRLALHRAARDALAPTNRAMPHLVPLRDLLALVIWTVSRFGRSAKWKDADVIL